MFTLLVHLTDKLIFLDIFLTACSGVQTFQSTLRAGDTVAVAAGMKRNFSRDNITVTITPSIGAPVTYLQNDPAVRAVVNLYPDPLSSLIVSEETGQDLTPFARTYSGSLAFFTDNSKDMWQTSVFIDLPDNLPVGLAHIQISNAQGDSASSTVNIIDGIGEAEIFEVEVNGGLSDNQFSALERVEHFKVSFSSVVIPYAVQVEFSHAADAKIGGNGVTYVSNPRGDLKNVTWNDDGSNLKVLLLPSKQQALTNMSDFDFYVTGGITGLTMSSISAVDIDGNAITDVLTSVVLGK